jgi:hypothetical protein
MSLPPHPYDFNDWCCCDVCLKRYEIEKSNLNNDRDLRKDRDLTNDRDLKNDRDFNHDNDRDLKNDGDRDLKNDRALTDDRDLKNDRDPKNDGDLKSNASTAMPPNNQVWPPHSQLLDIDTDPDLTADLACDHDPKNGRNVDLANNHLSTTTTTRQFLHDPATTTTTAQPRERSRSRSRGPLSREARVIAAIEAGDSQDSLLDLLMD